jgi:hypothetical protein
MLLLVGLGATATLTAAQPSRPGARPRPRPPRAQAHDGGPSESRTSGDGGTGEVVAQKTLDGGTKVFRFGELEIEGRLKNPQLVFFLRRVRAEFAAGDLGHRSFMRELGETKLDPNF